MTTDTDQDATEVHELVKQAHRDHDQTPDQATGDGRDWSAYSGPVWSAAEAARRCNVSRTTLTRRLNAGEIPGAEKTADGWQIPAQGLAIAGLAGQTAPDAPETDDGDQDAADRAAAEAAEVAMLRAQLETERARREGAERLADERAARILDLQTALRAIAPPPSDDSSADGDHEATGARSTPQTAAQDASPTVSSSTPPPEPRRGLFARLRDAITG